MNVQGWSRVLSFVLVAGLAFWFTIENAARRVRVDFLLFEIRTSVPLLVFLSVLAGMLAVFLVGLRADLRTRRALERYRGGAAPGFGPGSREAGAAGRWGTPRASGEADASADTAAPADARPEAPGRSR